MKRAIALLTVLVVATYWRAITLYFWVDDWDLFLKVVHPELGLWGMKPGLFGDGPYRYLHTPFLLLYPLFGLEASYYFAVGIGLYVVAAVSFYLLIRAISRSEKISFVSGVLFSSMGYVGSYTMTHLSNSYQMMGTVIMTNLMLLMLALFHTKRSLLYYIASIVVFWATVEFFFIRAHGIVFLAIAMPFILFIKKDKNIARQLALFTMQAVPFALLFHSMYKQAYHVSNGNATALNSFVTNMSNPENRTFLFYPFGSFGNAVIPDHITGMVRKLFSLSVQPDNAVIVAGGVLLVSILIYAGVMVARGRIDTARLVLFGMFWFFAYYIGYFISNPRDSLLPTIHRYLTTSTPGIALLVGSLVSSIGLRIRRVPVYIVLTVCIVSGYLILANNNLSVIHTQFSKPTRLFYKQLIAGTPRLSENPVMLFDVENDPAMKYRINSSFPATAIALFYGYKDRIPVYNALEDIIQKKELLSDNLENLHTFYISQRGIENTTDTVRTLLATRGAATVIPAHKWKSHVPFETTSSKFTVSTAHAALDGNVVAAHPVLIAPVSHTSIVPQTVTLVMTITPLSLNETHFIDVTSQMTYVTAPSDLEGLKLSHEFIAAHTVRLEKQRTEPIHAKLAWKTDQGSIYLTANTSDLSLIPDGKPHSYTVMIPAGGTRIEEVTIKGFDYPVNISLSHLTIQPMSRADMVRAHEPLVQQAL